MDILITDSMLREFLDSDATPTKIAECVSLCGPSVERVTKKDKETVYDIEVTTNRVDAASAYGFAREAAAILPEFGIKAQLRTVSFTHPKAQTKFGFDIEIDKNLCERFMAGIIMDVSIKDSSQKIKQRLSAVDIRPINNAVDITNYVMVMLGVPMHAFDLDKLGKKIIVREAKKGEKFTTLDGKSHITYGGEVVFDNGKGEIVDLPGVMGAQNSMITEKTKNILLVCENIDPLKVRQASLKHETRTLAAAINEKYPDPENSALGFGFALSLFSTEMHAKISNAIFDWYPVKRKTNKVKVKKEVIDNILGIELGKGEITRILTKLGFEAKWKDDELDTVVPSYRSLDITIQEDIAEEVARIYGYFKLPSTLPEGKIPEKGRETKFKFEDKVKDLLKGYGGVEVYTLSMVSKQDAGESAVKIKNPLGLDGEYMRTTLTPSILEAAKSNSQEKGSFHMFEMANVYLPKKNSLPVETMMLSGVFANTDFRLAKGVLEALFSELNISYAPKLIKSGGKFIYEYEVAKLMKDSRQFRAYSQISKFQAQVEDITVVMGSTKTEEVLKLIKEASVNISKVELKDMYEDFYTFRINYEHPEKTLTDKEVEAIRKLILVELKKNKLEVK